MFRTYIKMFGIYRMIHKHSWYKHINPENPTILSEYTFEQLVIIRLKKNRKSNF